MNRAKEIAGALISETGPVSDKGPDDAEPSPSSWDNQVDTQPLLPRSSWQNYRAFLKILIRAKRSLDIAEINPFLA